MFIVCFVFKPDHSVTTLPEHIPVMLNNINKFLSLFFFREAYFPMTELLRCPRHTSGFKEKTRPVVHLLRNFKNNVKCT